MSTTRPLNNLEFAGGLERLHAAVLLVNAVPSPRSPQPAGPTKRTRLVAMGGGEWRCTEQRSAARPGHRTCARSAARPGHRTCARSARVAEGAPPALPAACRKRPEVCHGAGPQAGEGEEDGRWVEAAAAAVPCCSAAQFPSPPPCPPTSPLVRMGAPVDAAGHPATTSPSPCPANAGGKSQLAENAKAMSTVCQICRQSFLSNSKPLASACLLPLVQTAVVADIIARAAM